MRWHFNVGHSFQGIHTSPQICKKVAVLSGTSKETQASQSAVTRSSSPSEDCEGLCCIGPCKIVCGAVQTQHNKRQSLPWRVSMREEKILCKKASTQTFKHTGMSHLVECCSGTWERGVFSGLWQNPSCHRSFRAFKLHWSRSYIKKITLMCGVFFLADWCMQHLLPWPAH